MDSTRTVKILDDIVITLDELGWIKGSLGNEGEGVCLAGAMYYAINGYVNPAAMGTSNWHEEREVGRLLRNEIEADGYRGKAPGVYWGIGDWNDVPERTLEDVKLIVKRVREKVASNGGE